MACGGGVCDECRARIGKKRRAGVGDERDRAPFGERVEKAAMRTCAAVLVIGGDLRGDAVAVEKPPRHARVLASDEVGAASVSSARSVTSERLPIGVATT